MVSRIMLGADIVPTESNFALFKQGDAKTLIGKELQEKLNGADFTIFNLEVPLVDKEEPIEKCGPNLIAPTSTIEGLKAINPYFFTLANNHILDQGKQGLNSTINTLNNMGIAYAGAGKNLAEAKKSYVVRLNGITVGIYCCAEHEFTVANEEHEGANPFDPLESLDHVNELKAKSDYVIVLYHGGKEHYRYPSPYLQKVCRKLVEKGADLVVCQHSHCIGAEEVWKHGRIVYGQGDFLFDHDDSEYWQTSLLVDVELDKSPTGMSVKIQYHPLCKVKEKVRLAKEVDKDAILTNFIKRSEEVKDSKKIEDFYQKFANEMLTDYLSVFTGNSTKSFCYRIFNKLSGYRLSTWRMKQKYQKQDRIGICGVIQCEAHRELILKGLMENKVRNR